MAIRSSGYYNNPAFAQAASNLAAMFAPPSGADASGWANAAATKEKASALAEAFRNMTAPGAGQGVADRYGVGATVYGGGYAPTSSYFAVNSSNATSRANNAANNAQAAAAAELAAKTNLEMNSADNQRALSQSFLTPIGPNSVRHVPPDLAEAFRTPIQQNGVMELDQGKNYLIPGNPGPIAGPPKPLTRAEVEGNLVLGLPQAAQDAIAFGNTPIEPIATPAGPRNVSRLAAMGAEPYTAPAAGTKPTNGVAVLQDGSHVPAVQGPDGRWKHAQTGAALPDNVQIFDVPKPQGTAEEIGLGKPVSNNIQGQLLDIATTRQTAARLRDLVSKNAGTQGLVGMVRGTVQDAIQQGGELGSVLSGTAKELMDGVKSGALDAGLVGQVYNPSLPAVKFLEVALPFQLAKLTTGERLSNEMLRNVMSSLGTGSLFSNQAGTIARIDEAMKGLDDREMVLRQALTGGVQNLPKPAPGAGPVPAPAAQPAPAGQPVPVSSPEEAMSLAPGTPFVTPDGRVKVRP